MPAWPGTIEVTQPQAGWLERYQTLITGILALFAGIGAVYGSALTAGATLRSTKHLIEAEDRRRTKEARDELHAIAGAFVAEISGLARLARERLFVPDEAGQLVNGPRRLALQCRQTRQAIRAAIPVTREAYTPIFNNYAGKVGSFPDPIPAKIVECYMSANSIIDALRGHYEGFYASSTWDELADHYDWLANIVDQALGAADELVPLLQAYRESRN